MRPDVEIERFAARHAPSLTAGSWVMQTEHSAPDSDRFRAMELTKTFAPEAYSSALESWSWLDIATKVPVLATLFGDVFFQDAGGYWFLDTIEGSLGKVAGTRDELQAKLDTPEGQDQYLLGGLAMALDRDGLQLQPEQVYDFKVPPKLGGTFEPSNITVMDFVVSVNIAGQLHDQIRNVPPGTKIKGIKVDQ